MADDETTKREAAGGREGDLAPDVLRFGGLRLASRRTYHMWCPRGHTWTEQSLTGQPYHWEVGFADGDGQLKILKTGPLCPYCLVDKLGEIAGAVVGHVQEPTE